MKRSAYSLDSASMPSYAPRRSIQGRRAQALASYSLLARRGRYAARPSSSALYGSGVAGSTRRARSSVGREVPLYLPPSRSREEAHALTVSSPSLNGDSTGSIVHLNAVAQGDGLVDRHAARILMRQLHVRGFVVANSAATLQTSAMLIVYDRQPQGALPAITDILDTVSPVSFQSLTNRDRFRILWRKDFSIEGNLSGGTTSTNQVIDQVVYVSLPAAYTVGTVSGAIANVKTGGLYVVTIGTSVAGAAACTYNCNFRTVFSP